MVNEVRRRDEGFAQGWGQIATLLPLDASGGMQKFKMITNDVYQQINKVSDTTAGVELHLLTKQKLLKRVGVGRGIKYTNY